MITPDSGGVKPMTVAMLMRNFLQSVQGIVSNKKLPSYFHGGKELRRGD